MEDYFGNTNGDPMFDYDHDGSLDFNESCAQNQYYQDMLEEERRGVIESSQPSSYNYDGGSGTGNYNSYHPSYKPTVSGKQSLPPSQEKESEYVLMSPQAFLFLIIVVPIILIILFDM